MKTATDIRKDARESLTGKWGKGALITLVYAIFSIILNAIEKNFEKELLGSIISLIVAIIEVPISFGLIISFIKLKRGEEVGAFDFFKDGFSNFKRAWGLAWNTFIKMILPVILIVVATIIMVMSGVATFFAGEFASSAAGTMSALFPIGVILFLVAMVYAVIKGFSYSMSNFIAYDNQEITTKEAVEKSEELMKGNKGNLFLLQLSFIGWAVLAIFTLGIGYLWLMAYTQVATICFYEELINNND